MTMTASAYKELYLNLMVPVVNEKGERTGWQRVRVDQYLLADRRPDVGRNLDALMGPIRNHFAKPGVTLKVLVGLAELGEKVFYSWQDAWYFAKKALWGKASPEELQVTLQLALRFKVVPGPESLQSYCDEKVGLDCNGFVGNYLEHGFRGKGWDSYKVGFSNYDANLGVRDLMQKLGPPLNSLDDVQMLQTYVMGLVDPHTNQVINQGVFPNIAHTVVTTPFTFVGMHEGKPHLMMRVVESTGGIGLTESPYFLLEGKNHVFKVWRGSKKETREFAIRPAK